MSMDFCYLYQIPTITKTLAVSGRGYFGVTLPSVSICRSAEPPIAFLPQPVRAAIVLAIQFTAG